MSSQYRETLRIAFVGVLQELQYRIRSRNEGGVDRLRKQPLFFRSSCRGANLVEGGYFLRISHQNVRKVVAQLENTQRRLHCPRRAQRGGIAFRAGACGREE